MSKPKAYPPYRVQKDEFGNPWVIDAHGNDVIDGVGLSFHYHEIYGDRIMQIICDALNQQEP